MVTKESICDRATRLRLSYGRGRKLYRYQAGQSPGDYFAVSKKFAGLILRSVGSEPDDARGSFPN